MDFGGFMAQGASLVYSGPVAGLPTPSAECLGAYAQATDLFGFKSDKVLCTSYLIGGVQRYYWEPLRPTAPNVSPLVADQNMTLRPLLTPSMLTLTGGMTQSRVITPDKVGAWPGLIWEIKMDGVLSLFTLTIAGLALGNVLSLLSGGSRRLIFDGTDYRPI